METLWWSRTPPAHILSAEAIKWNLMEKDLVKPWGGATADGNNEIIHTENATWQILLPAFIQYECYTCV